MRLSLLSSTGRQTTVNFSPSFVYFRPNGCPCFCCSCSCVLHISYLTNKAHFSSQHRATKSHGSVQAEGRSFRALVPCQNHCNIKFQERLAGLHQCEGGEDEDSHQARGVHQGVNVGRQLLACTMFPDKILLLWHLNNIAIAHAEVCWSNCSMATLTSSCTN